MDVVVMVAITMHGERRTPYTDSKKALVILNNSAKDPFSGFSNLVLIVYIPKQSSRP